MLAGTLRDRIQIEHRTVVDGPVGPTETWSIVERRWARVIPISANARVRYAQIQTEVTHEVLFRETVALEIGDHRLIWLTNDSKVLKLSDPPANTTGLASTTKVAVAEVVE